MVPAFRPSRRQSGPAQRPLRVAAPLAALLSHGLTGCAIHYYDPDTGTSHLFGFGHLAIRDATRPGETRVQAAVQEVESLGIGIGHDWNGTWLQAGWNASRRLLAADDVSLSLEGRSPALFDLRVGVDPPWLQGGSTPEAPAARIAPSAPTATPSPQPPAIPAEPVPTPEGDGT